MNFQKVRTYLIILLGLFGLCGPVFAKPDYCKFYPNFEKESTTNAYGSLAYCLNGQKEILEFSELSSLYDGSTEASFEVMSKDFKKLLASLAFEEILNKRKSYEGRHYGVDLRTSKALNSCVNNDSPFLRESLENFKSRKKQKFDYKRQMTALRLNVVNAMKAKALFKKNKNHHKLLNEAKIKLNQNNLTCRNERIKCRRETPFYKDTYHCSENYDFCKSYNQVEYKNKQKDLQKKKAPLYDMVSKSPLLFANKTDSDMIDFFSEDEIKPSNFMNEITKNIPDEVQKDMDNIISNPKSGEFDNFVKKHEMTLENMLKKPRVLFNLKTKMKDATQQEINRLDKAATEICKTQGEKLHYYPELVKKAMSRYIQTADNRDDLKRKVAFMQGGYCHSLNTDSPGDNNQGLAMIGGLALLGVGGSLQFIPGVGNIAGGALILAGSGMMIAGGGALTALGMYEGYEKQQELNADFGLNAIGFSDYERLLENKISRDDIFSDGALNTALGFVDILGLRYLNVGKYTKVKTDKKDNIEKFKSTSRRLNISKRQQLDRLEKWLGKNTEIYLQKYVGSKRTALNKADEIYLSGIIHMAEKKYKKKNPNFKQEDLEDDIKLIVDDVLNKCKVRN